MKPQKRTALIPTLSALLALAACGLPPGDPSTPPAPLARDRCVEWDATASSWPAGAVQHLIGGDPCRAAVSSGPAQATAWVARLLEVPAQPAQGFLYVEGTLTRQGGGVSMLALSRPRAEGGLLRESTAVELQAPNGRGLLTSDFLLVKAGEARQLHVQVMLQSQAQSAGYSVQLDPLYVRVVPESTAMRLAQETGRRLLR